MESDCRHLAFSNDIQRVHVRASEVAGNGSARSSSCVPMVFYKGLGHQRVFLEGIPRCRRNVDDGSSEE